MLRRSRESSLCGCAVLMSILPNDGDVSNARRYWRICVEQLTQVVVEEYALGVEGRPHAPEVVPARIEFGQFPGAARVYLAPVRSPLVAFEDFLDVPEVCFIGHTPVHMRGDIGRLALVSRAEPDVIGMHETALQREVDFELVPLDTLLNFGYYRARVLCRNVVLHLLEAHPAGCSEQAMAIVDLFDVGDRLPGDATDRLAEAGHQAAGLGEQPEDAVLQYNLIEAAPEAACGLRVCCFFDEFSLHPVCIREPVEFEVAVLLLVLFQVGDAVGQFCAEGLEMHTFGGYHAQLHLCDDPERS